MEATTTGGVRAVKSAEHTVAVLEYLASRQDRPARIREIVAATTIPRSSAYALLQTLTDLGWVERDQTGLLYGVGIRALIAGVSYLDADPRLGLLRPWLDRLRTELDETIHLARLDGAEIVYLATRESGQYLRAINRVGRRLPAHATSLGKALLASLPDDELDRTLELLPPDPLPSLTAHTLTTRRALRADLRAVRERGWASDHEENTEGLRCLGIALPVPRGTNPVRDAISCSVPSARLTAEREARIAELLLATAGEIASAHR
ncbi:MAG TPA: IclR family transcriptional regulator [Candidatus Avipropionibacterium avicola]|uniref:Glycerol operon regulatory protein n=1 Tax=Candidatus Avipropionibacterium avicola TaxID=2840701 RepID=A0A9D1GUM4_9ACTN|nr:IclR family transcriptional regulator [Candidatus Avipropionibacterium avicola]